MTDIGPGDWVECIDDSPGYKTGRTGLFVKGQLYRVEELQRNTGFFCVRDGCGSVGFRINGLDHVCPNRFRPIHRRSSFNCEELLTNIPADLKEPEPA